MTPPVVFVFSNKYGYPSVRTALPTETWTVIPFVAAESRITLVMTTALHKPDRLPTRRIFPTFKTLMVVAEMSRMGTGVMHRMFA